MASSIMHLAITSELTKHFDFSDIDRLKFGVVLPDAGKGNASHLNKYLWGLNKKAYDFELFRSKYGELMKRDDLYLGYYLHLVQDYFSSIGITAKLQERLCKKLCNV